MYSKLVLVLPLAALVGLPIHAQPMREEMTIADRVDERFSPADKATGVIVVGARPYQREMKLTCDALAARRSEGDAWLRLVVASDISGIAFDRREDIDLVSSVAMPQLTGTIPPNVTRTVSIDHTNVASTANALSCRVTVK